MQDAGGDVGGVKGRARTFFIIIIRPVSRGSGRRCFSPSCERERATGTGQWRALARLGSGH